nr:acetoin utilization protein AcuC [Salsipaludibacter albus]
MVWDDALAAYEFSADHPLKPVRVELTVDLVREVGLLAPDHVVTVAPGEPDLDEVLHRHRADYVAAVRHASDHPADPPAWAHGLGSADNPVFAGMHEASLLVCAASREAARMVLAGEVDHAFNPAGGLHHAMPDRAAGFCIYNDPAIAIDHLLAGGMERVCYVDVDVHHGDGVEAMFADDPRVLTISLHESGRHLFPGTGAASDVGGPGALGSVANLPFMPGTTGDVWLETFDRVVEPLVRAFNPDALVTQLGCDTHVTDPLAHLSLTTDDFGAIVARLHTLAHEAAGGRWVATGGGGYQWVHVVPRVWTMAFAEMTGATLPVDIPMTWRETARRRTGQKPPESFWEAPVAVNDHLRRRARDEAEQSARAVEELVLPHHGL